MALDFRKTLFIGVAADLNQCPPVGIPEVVLSGRSNVGKSSLINALADHRHLAKISSAPGKTRLIVYFRVDNRLLLADLPGYGYASVSHQTRDTFAALADSYLTSGRPIALVLHLMDIRHSPSAEDLQMLEWLQVHQVPCQIVLAKADKLNRSQIVQRQREMAAALHLADPAELLVFSATSRQGMNELRGCLAGCLDQRST